MANVPGSKSTPHRATEAPQATSPSQPEDAVAIAHWGAVCLLELLLGRRLPLDPSFSVGCGMGGYPGHKGLDFYKTPSDIPVKRSCPFQATGVSGANVYPAFPGCSHQATLAKVVYAQNAGGAIGNCVILEHTDNTHQIWVRTVYMHLATITVTVGQFVPVTTSIGTVGYTGGYASTNAHLHFEVNEQRPANFYWRVAGELALMPNRIVANRPAIDPEIYLPPVEGGELLRIASPPPPAQYPPKASVQLPTWRPYPQLPASNDTGSETTWEDAPAWYIYDIAAPKVVDVYPFLDAPDGSIYVIAVRDREAVGAAGKEVWLLHSDQRYRQMVTTLYWIGGPGDVAVTVYVSAGQFITLGTRLARATGTSQNPGVAWTVLVREAASALQWEEDETFDLSDTNPISTYNSDAVSPQTYAKGLPGAGAGE